MSRGSKWIPLDKYLAQEFKSIKREFSMIEAMFSYQLDIDKGIIGTISGYSKLWGWSRNKVRRFLNGIRTDEGHLKDSKRTDEGHPIHFIDLSLNDKKDRSRTDRGQIEDTKHDTTTNPNPNPNPKPKKKDIKKKSFSKYLYQKIIENNLIENKDKIFEFYQYRMDMQKSDQYKSEKGIDFLFKDLTGCRSKGFVLSDCIDEAIGRGWKTPKPDYFKNNIKNKPVYMSREDKNKQACMEFINEGVKNG